MKSYGIGLVVSEGVSKLKVRGWISRVARHAEASFSYINTSPRSLTPFTQQQHADS